MKPRRRNRLGIVVGGGPAPGINGVISAATIEACERAWTVVGILDGFQHLMKGDVTQTVDLDIMAVSRIHLTGGSVLRTSRANPTKRPDDLKRVVRSLSRLNITHLLTIGGDDTCLTASRIAAAAPGLRVAHVPKTIDNDVPLPEGVDTFGFQTARDVATTIVANLMEDAKTTNRWYVVEAMGRHAGHLALGMGKSAGATLTIIPEEFGDRPVTLRHILDILFTSVLKRRVRGKKHGVAVLAEGLVERLGKRDLATVGVPPADEFGHFRLAEADLVGTLQDRLSERMKQCGWGSSVVAKVVGYELRSAPPIPFDCEYVRDLGYAAIKLLDDRQPAKTTGNGAIVCIQGGRLRPIPFCDAIGKDGRVAVRMVSIDTESYAVARSYMIRLEKADLAGKTTLPKLAAACGMSPAGFVKRFGYLVR